MTLRDWINQGTTASTTRPPAMSSEKIGAATTYLENVKITEIQFTRERGANANAIRQAAGLEGSAVADRVVFTMSHTHDKDSSPVTELPDIREGDRLVTGGVTYAIRRVLPQPAGTVLSAFLEIYMKEDKRT